MNAIANVGFCAVRRDRAHQKIHFGGFFFWLETEVNGIDACCISNLLCGQLAVAGQEDRACNALRFQFANSICRLIADCILHLDRTGIVSFICHIDDCASQFRNTLNAAGDHQLAVADENRSVMDAGTDASAREFFEFHDLLHLSLVGIYQCAGYRMC